MISKAGGSLKRRVRYSSVKDTRVKSDDPASLENYKPENVVSHDLKLPVAANTVSEEAGCFFVSTHDGLTQPLPIDQPKPPIPETAGLTCGDSSVLSAASVGESDRRRSSRTWTSTEPEPDSDSEPVPDSEPRPQPVPRPGRSPDAGLQPRDNRGDQQPAPCLTLSSPFVLPSAQSTRTSDSTVAGSGTQSGRRRKCPHDSISLTTYELYTYQYRYRKPVVILMLLCQLISLFVTIPDYSFWIYAGGGAEWPLSTRFVIVFQAICVNVLLPVWNIGVFYFATSKSQRSQQISNQRPKCGSCGKTLTTEEAFACELADSKNTEVVKKVTKHFISPQHDNDIEKQLEVVEIHVRGYCVCKSLYGNIAHVFFVGIALSQLAHVSLWVGLRIVFILLWMFTMKFISSFYSTEMYVKRYAKQFCRESENTSSSLRTSGQDVIDCVSNRWHWLELGKDFVSVIFIVEGISLLFAGVPMFLLQLPLSSGLLEVNSMNWLYVIVFLSVGHLVMNSFLPYYETDLIGLLVELIAFLVLYFTSCSPLTPPVALVAVLPMLQYYFLLIFLFWFQLEKCYWNYTVFDVSRKRHKLNGVICRAGLAFALLILFVASLKGQYNDMQLKARSH